MNRRGFLRGLGASLIAAPAVIRIPGLLMPVRALAGPQAVAAAMRDFAYICHPTAFVWHDPELIFYRLDRFGVCESGRYEGFRFAETG